jgi:hypothetical protein
MSLFTAEDTHPLTLARVLTNKYGPDWTRWGPDVLRQTIQMDYQVSVSKINLARALGAGVVMLRDSFWMEYEAFLFLAQALCGMIPIPGEHVELTVGQMMTAVDIANQLRKDLKDLSYVPKFEEEVARYVSAQAKNQGVWYLPPPLDFANRFASGLRYRCNSCGTENEILDDEAVMCDVCSERVLPGIIPQVTSWRPNPKYMKDATNITIFEMNPTDKVKERLKTVMEKPDTLLEETSADVCVARIIASLAEMRKSQERAKAQRGIL